MQITSRKYAFQEEDFERLNKERPFGISGHLWVKNEAGTLCQCVLSIIESLDELIVSYQASEDETEHIIQELAAQFSQKIRVFFILLM